MQLSLSNNKKTKNINKNAYIKIINIKNIYIRDICIQNTYIKNNYFIVSIYIKDNNSKNTSIEDVNTKNTYTRGINIINIDSVDIVKNLKIYLQ